MNDIDVKPDGIDRAPGRRTGGQRAWLRRAVPPAALAATVTVALAACAGGSSGPGVASGGLAASAATPSGSASSSAYDQALAYARCIRSHGEPDYPDPIPSGQQPPGGGLDTSSPQFRAAQDACRSLAPHGSISLLSPAQQARARAELLKFSRCMRTHGEPDFPDDFQDIGGPAARSPQFRRALQACRSYLVAAKPSLPAGS
jgi:hypothetical protein